MAIGWFPGHMNKARKDIQQTLKQVDAVMEILDARLPFSSANPMLAEMVGDVPVLKILNKADLADPGRTDQWLDYYNKQGQEALALEKSQVSEIRKCGRHCYDTFHKPGKRQFKILIVGIPNVGKSTWLNILLDRKIAKTGNEPAVTKARQEVKLDERIWLIDTPGVLWPKLDPPDCGYRLAASGAVRNTAYEFDDVALWTVEYLMKHYPDLIRERYQLTDLDQPPVQVMEDIGKQRGCLVRGGVDFTKTGEVLLHDLRDGKIGRITLETPADIPVSEKPDNPVSEKPDNPVSEKPDIPVSR